jgi:oligoribonuclease NrnB/cAMP/cGMP phosphodiesterase (DHH superfamily)
MPIKCFYHSADLDGHCSGAIVKYKFPKALMYPINYGDKFPWDDIKPDDIVYMVDFALQPFEDMLTLDLSVLSKLYWIDHHSSAIESSDKSHFGLRLSGKRNTSKAACELVWEYLFPDKPVPLAVKLLSLYDSWTYQDHELEDLVLPFQMRMRMENLNPKNWDEVGIQWNSLLEGEQQYSDITYTRAMIHNYVSQGKLLLKYDQEQKKKYAETYAFETIIEIPIDMAGEKYGHVVRPYKAIVVNLGHTNSKVFDSVWEKTCDRCDGMIHIQTKGNLLKECRHCKGTGLIEPYDVMVTFCRRKDKLWNVSLYSTKPEVDCGAIAKTFGGGGHKGAAGFQCKELPFEY